MTEETATGEAPDDFTLPPIIAPNIHLGGGNVGDTMAEARSFAEEYMRVEPITVIEPDTGVAALAYVAQDRVHPVDPTIFEPYRDNPKHRRGTATMTTIESFIAHVNRFGDVDSAIFADDNRLTPRMTAVLDYHRKDTLDTETNVRVHGEYRHGRHGTCFAFPMSDEWKAWNKVNHCVMSMIEFALFLEKNMGDIAVPGDDYPEDVERFVATRGGPDMIADYAKLVELSRGLKVNEDATIEEAQTLNSGEGHIRFTNEHRTTRNAAGDTVKVPTLFFIAIPIFKRGAFYRIAAALNYRKTSEGVKFWFDLYREDRAFDHAFNEVVQRVDAETEAQVFFGASE